MSGPHGQRERRSFKSNGYSAACAWTPMTGCIDSGDQKTKTFEAFNLVSIDEESLVVALTEVERRDGDLFSHILVQEWMV